MLRYPVNAAHFRRLVYDWRLGRSSICMTSGLWRAPSRPFRFVNLHSV